MWHVKKGIKKVPGIGPYRAMASTNKRSCHRFIRSAMFPVTLPIPNTTSTGLAAVAGLAVHILYRAGRLLSILFSGVATAHA